MLYAKHLKALKRKRLLLRRIKCHGNKISCMIEHAAKPKTPNVEKQVSRSWFDVIKSIIKRIFKL